MSEVKRYIVYHGDAWTSDGEYAPTPSGGKSKHYMVLAADYDRLLEEVKELRASLRFWQEQYASETTALRERAEAAEREREEILQQAIDQSERDQDWITTVEAENVTLKRERDDLRQHVDRLAEACWPRRWIPWRPNTGE